MKKKRRTGRDTCCTNCSRRNTADCKEEWPCEYTATWRRRDERARLKCDKCKVCRWFKAKGAKR